MWCACRLFWGYKGHVPQCGKTGLQNLGVLVRDCQLSQLNDNYTRLLTLETIWQEPEHGQFHLYRKLIRCGAPMLALAQVSTLTAYFGVERGRLVQC
jgi:hypothetical protein